MRTTCLQDTENISSPSFSIYPVVPIKLEKIKNMKKKMSVMYLEMLNIKLGLTDPKDNRRVK